MPELEPTHALWLGVACLFAAVAAAATLLWRRRRREQRARAARELPADPDVSAIPADGYVVGLQSQYWPQRTCPPEAPPEGSAAYAQMELRRLEREIAVLEEQGQAAMRALGSTRESKTLAAIPPQRVPMNSGAPAGTPPCAQPPQQQPAAAVASLPLPVMPADDGVCPAAPPAAPAAAPASTPAASEPDPSSSGSSPPPPAPPPPPPPPGQGRPPPPPPPPARSSAGTGSAAPPTKPRPSADGAAARPGRPAGGGVGIADQVAEVARQWAARRAARGEHPAEAG
eukprot:TRINITY_DN23109_c0_g2_i1.p1 TRINITY_DN23109_c0_g2~~TRINITY_DN23109_c0_g2_i1.p1  ORF type:complete len:318 (+),score=66.45 TRINITY_DN23109_c0_g2_i1:101-955(+)